MKPSSTWFALILILSALVLSVASKARSNATSNSTPRPAAETQTDQSESHNQATKPGGTPATPFAVGKELKPAPFQSPSASPTPRGDDQQSSYIRTGLIINCVLAAATLMLALVGIFQARASAIAANAAKDSADSYRKALALQARPLLRVRQAQLITERPYIKAGYVLVNVGGSTAHITSITHALTVGGVPPSIFEIQPFKLEAGEKYVATVQAGASLLPNEILTSLKLTGRIIYTDEAGIVRETSVNRPYRFDLHIFERVSLGQRI
jgi:hypothetical protein